MHCGVHEHLEVLPVLVEQLELEGIRDGIRRDPWFGLRLEAADKQAANLLLDVGPAVRVAQDRQVAMDALDLVGDDIEVLGRVKGDVDAGHRADGVGPLTCAVDDDLGLDVPVVGAHGPGASAPRPLVDQDVGDAHALEDADSPGPRTFGERLGEIGRVGAPVAGQPDRPDEVVVADEGIALLGLRGREELALQAVGRGARHRAPQRHHPIRRAGHRHSPADPIPRRQPGLLLEPGVEVGGVLHEARACLGGTQLADQARRVPGRAAGEGALLEQDDIGPAEVSQVVGDRRADDSAADDDHAGPVGQGAIRQGAIGQDCHRGDPTVSRSASKPGSAKACAARSILSIAHSQKSKSRSEAPA